MYATNQRAECNVKRAWLKVWGNTIEFCHLVWHKWWWSKKIKFFSTVSINEHPELRERMEALLNITWLIMKLAISRKLTMPNNMPLMNYEKWVTTFCIVRRKKQTKNPLKILGNKIKHIIVTVKKSPMAHNIRVNWGNRADGGVPTLWTQAAK